MALSTKITPKTTPSSTRLDDEMYVTKLPANATATTVSSTFYPSRKLNLSVAIETEQEDDGRWIAEAPDLPGVMVYGDSEQQARENIQPLILRVIAERLENGEHIPERVFHNAAAL